MDCKTFRKYVGAFADGELQVTENVEALEHLNMCPGCAQRVAEVSEMKAALQRVLDTGSAPPSLVDRVRDSLDGERDRLQERKGMWRPMVFRLAVPVGLAAAILLVGVLSWFPWDRPIPPGVLTVVTGQPLADVWQQHQSCLRREAEHHDPALPRELDEIARRLSVDLRLAVIAPDLSPYGFKLLGADRCGIRGRPGAHVLYHAQASKQAISVFTVGRWDGLGSGGAHGIGDDTYFVSDGSAGQVVAWHSGPQTYAICGSLTKDELIGMAGEMRMADADHPGSIYATTAVLAVAD